MKLSELTEIQLKYAIKKTMRAKTFLLETSIIINDFEKKFKIHKKQALKLFNWALSGDINKKFPRNFNVDSMAYS